MSGYGLACRLLSIFLILFQSSCALSPQTRDQLNAGAAVTSATFNPQIGGYCTPGLGDIFDATTLKLSSLAPNTYCLLDNFGVDRTVVLAVLEKYDGATSIDDAQAQDIDNSLHVFALIDKIAALEQQQGAGQASIQYPIRVASLYDFPLPARTPFEVSQADALPVLILTLAVWGYLVPGFMQYIKDNPFHGLNKSSPDYEERQEVRAQIIAAAEEDIDKELCKNLACQTVAVTDETVTAGTCPPNSSCPPVDCDALYRKISQLVGTLKGQYARMSRDQYQLFTNAHDIGSNPGGALEGKGTWVGHQEIYNDYRAGLQNNIDIANVNNCPIPPDAEEWANKPPPSSPGG